MRAPLLTLSDIENLCFDVVGTLVDDDSAFSAAADRLAAVCAIDRPAALRTRWEENLDDRMSAVIAGQSAWRPHRELVVKAARHAIGSFGAPTSLETDAIASALVTQYQAWPDVEEGTARLSRHLLVAGVSNADVSSLARLAQANRISWHLALSTGAVGTFKPARAAYQFAIDALSVDPARTLFVAAHPWDLRAAAEHGFRTAYIRRPNAERPSEQDSFDVEADDLLMLCDILGV